MCRPWFELNKRNVGKGRKRTYLKLFLYLENWELNLKKTIARLVPQVERERKSIREH